MPRGGLAVWVIEPYFGGSHRSFLEGLVENSSHDLELFTLPGRNWKWRMQGGALTLAERVCERWAADGSGPDVFFVSDMLDLPVFVAATGTLGKRSVPTLLYLHENQLTYPLPPGVDRDLGYGFKNMSSAAVADSVVFNSGFHRGEFLQAASDLMRQMPDEAADRVISDIRECSRVVAVGCDLRRFDACKTGGRQDGTAGRWGDPAAGPLLLWNQRWEYDKAPGDLFKALYALKEAGASFRLAIAGPNQGTPTAEFLRAKEELADHIVQWGRVDDPSEYASLLWSADVVVSTAIHEFFGVAVVEAVYCGCRPVLPRRLSYPEIIPEEAHGEVLYGEGGLVPALKRALEAPDAWSEDWQRSWVARYDWGAMRYRFDEEIERCGQMAGSRRHRWVDENLAHGGGS